MISPMLLSSCKELDLSIYEGTHIAQLKMDGTRIIATKKGDKITLVTRSGKSELSEEYPDIIKALSISNDDFIVDGELVFYDNVTGKQKFLTGKAKESREGLTPRLHLFDILKYCQSCHINNPLSDRLMTLEYFVKMINSDLILFIASYVDNFNEMYDSVIRDGQEGIVIKELSSTYQIGKRSKSWLKVKRKDTADCFIIGLMKGEGKYESQFGSLILGQYDKSGNVIVVCNCSGMTDEQRTAFTFDILQQPWSDVFPSTKGELGHIKHKCDPKVVVEISFMTRLDSGSMRHPRFIRVRTDKEPKDCVFEQ
jgi:bifunctional non-homologous end joining protein LigD